MKKYGQLIPVLALSAVACGTDVPLESECGTDIADLNGDGIIDDADCALAQVGVATRFLCESEPERWVSSAACGSTQTVALTTGGGAGGTYSVRFVPLGSGAFATFSPDGARIDRPPQIPGEGWTSSAVASEFGSQRPEFGASAAGANVLGTKRGWLDRNGDQQMDGDEIFTNADIFGEDLIGTPLIGGDTRSIIVVGRTSSDPRLRAWKDLNRNLALDPGELIVLDSTSDALALYTSPTTSFDSIVFKDSNANGEFFWSDTNRDWLVQPTEIGGAGQPTPCVHYWDGSYCSDATGHLLDASIHPPQLLDAPPNFIGAGGSPLEVRYGASGASGASNAGPWIWRDGNRNNSLEPWEAIQFPYLSGLGGDVFVTSFGLSLSSAHLVMPSIVTGEWTLTGVSRFPASAYLGEYCSALAPCADSLTCASLGNQGSRCIPRPEGI